MGDDLHERKIRAAQSEAVGAYVLNSLHGDDPKGRIEAHTTLMGLRGIASKDTIPAEPLPDTLASARALRQPSPVFTRDESSALDLRPYGAKPFDYPLRDPLLRPMERRPGNTRIRDVNTAFVPRPLAPQQAPADGVPGPWTCADLDRRALVFDSSKNGPNK